MTPNSFLVPFGVNAPLFSDSASKSRWIAVPNDGAPYDATEKVAFAPTGEWSFPNGTVFVKHFELAIDETQPSARKRLETRFLVRDSNALPQNSLYGVTYKWREDNSEADLLPAGLNEDLTIKLAAPVGSVTGQDIGGPLPAGSTTAIAGGYRVVAGGADIWNNADQFHFAHQQRTGDFDVKARIAALSQADLYTKAGLMAREDLSPGSRHVFFLAFPSNAPRNNNDGGYEFQHRAQANGASVAIYPTLPHPTVDYAANKTWMRLRRVGDTFYAYTSTDGISWRLYTTYTLALPQTVYFGLAVTSHNQGTSTTADFTDLANNRAQTWYYPSRSDCLFCHNQNAKFVLGVKTRQLNGDFFYPSTAVSDNQLRSWNNVQLFDPALNEADIPTYSKLVNVTDGAASLEDRSRSYIDSNCAHCHRPGGVQAFFDGRWDTPLANQDIVDGFVGNELGIDNARVVKAQDVYRSILFVRDNSIDPAIKMPPLAKNTIDQPAMAVIRDWINSLPGTPALEPPVLSPTPYATYTGSVDVTISHTDPAAELRYTLDGTLPTAGSTLYTAPVTLAASATVKAKAFKTGFVDSVAATASYTVIQLRDPENPSNVMPGVRYAYYEFAGNWTELPDFTVLTPMASGFVSTFDIAPRLRNDQFAFRFIGYVDIPQNGMYTFSTNSDDGSKLYIGTTQVVNNDGLHGPLTASGSIGLKAGRHAITVTMFEQGGTESLVVNYSGPGISGNPVIPASALYTDAPPTIDPNGGTFTTDVSISISASAGVMIYYTTDGSTPTTASPQYTAPFVLSATTTVKALGVRGAETDGPIGTAVFTLGDVPPDVSTVYANEVPARVIVVFNEPVTQASAETLANYSVNTGVILNSAALGADQKTVTLGASPLNSGLLYVITISNIQDRDTPANTIAAGTQRDFGITGSIARQVYQNIGGGGAVTDLTGNAKYPNNPDISDIRTSFEGPADWDDAYGTRMRGYVYPPATGSYVFWIASDDSSELWLSPNANPASKILIASVNGWTASREWTKFASQQSAPQSLVAGQRYYIEALHKEGGGLDNLAVGWQLPDTTLERPIPGIRLSPYYDQAVQFAVVSSSVNENAGTASLTVSLSAAATVPVTVNYSVTGGTASGSDFTLAPSQLTFNPGTTTQNIIITINDDALDELDETIQVALSSAANALMGANHIHTLTITDDDNPPTVAFTQIASSAAENAGSTIVEVSLSGPSGLTVTVNYAVTGGSASGADYSIAGTSLTFNPGETAQNITVNLTDDAAIDPNETVVIGLNTPGNAALGANTSHTFTINDDEPPPVAAFAAASSNGSESVTAVNLNVSLSAPTTQTVTVTYALTGGSASSGTDFTIAGNTLTFDPGVTSLSVAVSVVDDALDEPDETIEVTISSPVNATLGAATIHTYTINDDDNPPSVGFTLNSSSAGEQANSATIEVSLSAPSALTITVDYAVSGGSATGADFSISGSSLTFNPGETAKNITVSLTDDNISELGETVQLALSNPVNATLGVTPHVLTITDNDGTPAISFAAASSSGVESSGNALLSVTLSNPSSQTVTVDYAVSGGSAGSGDYTLNGSTLSLAAGATSASITLAITADTLAESDETVAITLSNPVNAALGATSTHTRTIVDDDTIPTIAFTVATSNAVEGAATPAITVQLSQAFSQSVSVSLTLGGSATLDGDFQLGATSLTFAPGETTKLVPLSALDDAHFETDETVQLSLANPVNATLGATTSHTFTILADSDPQPVVTLGQGTSSGAEASGDVQVTVSLSAPAGVAVSVDYSATGGTATATADYGLPAGTLTFAPGETSKTFTIGIVRDSADENDETIVVGFSNAVNATINGSLSLTHTVNDSNAPVIDSPITPSANPGIAGQPVQFSAGSTSSATLVWSWNFGDGTTVTGSSATHTFSTPGAFTVRVTATDSSGQSATQTLQFNVAAGPPDNDRDGIADADDPDDDNDGATDAAEATAGTNPLNPLSKPGGTADLDGDGTFDDLDGDDDNDGVSDANEIADGTDAYSAASTLKLPMTVSKVQGSVNFALNFKDKASVSGIIPNLPALYNPFNDFVEIDIGGATVDFLLDARGRGKDGQGMMSLKLKPSKRNKATKRVEFLGGPVAFKISLKKGAWTSEWLNEGVNPASNATKAPLPMTIDLTINGRVYTATVTTTYSAKAGKSGKFKK